jgi:molybdenum ABC transporter molybdate-binding protein
VFRVPSFLVLAAGSLAALAVLVYLLAAEARPDGRPLLVYCAAALKPAAEATAAAFTEETGQRVEFRFGNSESVLANATLTRDGDLFLPADDSYVRTAEKKGLVVNTRPLARMRAVVLVRPGNPRGVRTFDDLLTPGLRLGQANPDSAAIASVSREHLRTLGRWESLATNTLVYHSTVTEAANAVKLGSNDAAIVWDAVAANYPDLVAVRLPELDGATGRVELAVLASSRDRPAAYRFARYFVAADRGMIHLHAAGFTDLEPGPAWGQP